MRTFLVAMVVLAGALGAQPARAQASASAGVSVTILDPVGVGEGEAPALASMSAPAQGPTASGLSGRFALDGSADRTVSIAASAAPLAHANGSDRLSVDVRASRTGSGFDLVGGVVARPGASPGLYAGAVSVVVNYN